MIREARVSSIGLSPSGVTQLPRTWMAKSEPISRWAGPRMTQIPGILAEEKTAPATGPE